MGYTDYEEMIEKFPKASMITDAEEEVQEPQSFNYVLRLIDYELGFKHPLEHTWTLWHWENDRSKCWSDMLSEVTSFNTVEDFFSVYYFIKPPSCLRIFNDYMVFKNNIRPMWEDESNKEGGRWILIFDKTSRHFIDKLWHDLLLIIIGECFGVYSDQICGAVINVRTKATKLSLWTKYSYDAAAVMAIGQKMKELLMLGGQQLSYQVHSDAMIQHGRNVNAIFLI